MATQLRHLPPPPLAGNRRTLAGTLIRSASSSLAPSHRRQTHTPSLSLPLLLRSGSSNTSISLARSLPIPPAYESAGGGGGGGAAPPRGGSSGGGWGSGDDPDPPPRPSDPIGIFLEGWRSRVSADPEFPFKVLMEELIGVSANVLGDMASRPNFGITELDLVFSTLVVGSIVNFVLMYLLAPTSSIASSAAISHMFEPGNHSLLTRLGVFASKGAAFAAVGFAAGLAGTAISNTLVALRRRVGGAAASAAAADESPARSPPTVLNALTWAAHMGVSSNFRYQALNGIEYAAAKTLPPPGFKAAVVVLRCLNNVLGGMSFVALARITGSQKATEEKPVAATDTAADGAEELQSEAQAK
ncbi:protein RETICULATA-RELATED 3, chloroplastic-like [Ananas comosus]|uniref:Protein RETICULATA-RELATED 3, chloroplastic-like n=1 Tax=Ananas comosus TaxID=4615 RepID=A0A6P5EWR8_ANACO|nr:protein RETICULATA-RELATED 3, chloroplastic-like [Ananas comosus]